MKTLLIITIILASVLAYTACQKRSSLPNNPTNQEVTAKEILGNPKYRAISYGGYRKQSREQQPSVQQLKEDILLLHAMDIRLIRTYNVHYAHAENVLKAISEIKIENPSFDMYVMLGAWIDCAGAWTDHPNHFDEAGDANAKEIAKAIALTNQYPDIVKIIAVGNEAMVKWAASYFVQPWVILKYVQQLQQLKKDNKLPSDLWITSSDNFASWGGGGNEYHVEDLTKLIRAVDFVSMHTYPMHDTHYNPVFWGNTEDEEKLKKEEKIEKAMARSIMYAQSQYDSTKSYVHAIAPDKPIHIGETGWASASNSFYGPNGTHACDEYKEGIYHRLMRAWTDSAGISCFYFEAFDEAWKDAANQGGSENHFGLFTLDGEAKYAIWDKVDKGVFEGMTRGGYPITKTYDGDKSMLLDATLAPPIKSFITTKH